MFAATLFKKNRLFIMVLALIQDKWQNQHLNLLQKISNPLVSKL